jgi:hypothetical protein
MVSDGAINGNGLQSVFKSDSAVHVTGRVDILEDRGQVHGN